MLTGVWWGDLRGKRPVGRPRRRWEGNIKMGLTRSGLASQEGIFSMEPDM